MILGLQPLLSGTIYNSTSPTTDPAVRVESNSHLQWLIKRGTSDGFRLIRLRRDISQTDSVEGVFTCDIEVDTGPPISLGIYYASKSCTFCCVRCTCDYCTCVIINAN